MRNQNKSFYDVVRKVQGLDGLGVEYQGLSMNPWVSEDLLFQAETSFLRKIGCSILFNLLISCNPDQLSSYLSPEK